MEKDELWSLLRTAFVDETFAAMQYWAGGMDRALDNDVSKELLQHARDERQHAQWIEDFAVKHFDAPLTVYRKDAEKLTHCGFVMPDKDDVIKTLDQNIDGEACAIDYYESLLTQVAGDEQEDWYEPFVKLINRIVEKEREHKADLERLRDERTGKPKER